MGLRPDFDEDLRCFYTSPAAEMNWEIAKVMYLISSDFSQRAL